MPWEKLGKWHSHFFCMEWNQEKSLSDVKLKCSKTSEQTPKFSLKSWFWHFLAPLLHLHIFKKITDLFQSFYTEHRHTLKIENITRNDKFCSNVWLFFFCEGRKAEEKSSSRALQSTGQFLKTAQLKSFARTTFCLALIITHFSNTTQVHSKIITVAFPFSLETLARRATHRLP